MQLEEKMAALKSRTGFKATAEMEGVIEGLRLKALAQLPPFLLSLIRPLKSASRDYRPIWRYFKRRCS